jgi:hypothetical protein
MIIAPGSVDVTTYFKLVDPAAGTPETGLDVTALDATYVRDRATAVKADLALLGAVDAAHANNSAIEVDATNAPGLYRVDWPDAAFATGVSRVQLVVNGAAIDPAAIEVELAVWLTPITGSTVRAVNASDAALAVAATALTDATWTDARAGYLDNISGHVAQTGDVFEILTSAGGSATSNGAADGTTLIDSAQTGANDLYNSLAIKITSGDYAGQVRTIKDWDLASTTFTLTRGFGGQIVTGVTYRVVSSLVYQPGIALVPSASPIVEPDTLETISVAITTNAGAPTTAEITPGTITIARIRAGASTNIVTGAACSEAAGNIYYLYTYPSASWNEGDYYLATMSGQEIEVNGITYPLSTIPFRGYVNRESSILADTNELQTDDVPTLIAALNDLSAADVNAEVDTALADYDAPTKAELDTAVANVSVDEIQASALADLFNTDSGTDYASAVAGSVVKETADNAGGSALTVDAIADGVWDEAKSGHVAAGSFGEEVQAHPTAAEVNAEVDTALADIDLDHLIQVTAGAEEPTDGSYLDQVMHKDASQTFSASTDSLEAIRDRLVSTTVTAVAAVSGSTITVYRDTTWSFTVQDSAIDLSSRDSNGCYFSVKTSKNRTDDDALLRVQEGASGLERWDGAAPADASKATLVVNGDEDGVAVTVDESITSIAAGSYVWDLKMIDTGNVQIEAEGTFVVSGVVTRKVTA